MRQRTFSDPAYEHKKKVTRKERFLTEMDKVLPWKRLLKPLVSALSKRRAGGPLLGLAGQ